MNDLRLIGFLSLALVGATLAWLCLVFAGAASGSHDHGAEILGALLVFLAAGYGLLTMELSLRAFGRLEVLDTRALRISLSVAGFFSVLPIGITFGLGDVPALLTLGACIFAVLPWSFPHRQGADPDPTPES